MKRSLATMLALAICLMLGTFTASANLVFDFANVTNAKFQFDGPTNTFTFTNGVGGFDFNVTSQSGPWPGTITDYKGDLDGTWTVSDVGNPADVSGTGTLKLMNTVSGAYLNGDLIWSTIGTLGAGGTINVFAALNFTNFTLVGVDSNLSALFNAGAATIVVTFQSVTTAPAATEGPGCSGDLLGQLRCGGLSTASYSGTLTAVPGEPEIPEPSTMFLSGFALLGLGLLRRRMVRS